MKSSEKIDNEVLKKSSDTFLLPFNYTCIRYTRCQTHLLIVRMCNLQ